MIINEHQILEPISAAEDPALHTVQTIGALSNKVARRVYRTVSSHIKSLKKEDLAEYLASLIAVLRLTQYLNILNDRNPPQDQASSSAVVIASPKIDVK